MSDINTNAQLLSLLQLCDTSFPTGGFSHSFGLETYIQEEKVINRETFAQWLEAYLQGQLVYTDGLGCRLAYDCLEQENLEQLWELDNMIFAQALAREAREGNTRMGQRMIQLGRELFALPTLTLYQEQVNKHGAHSHPALVFAIIAYHLQIPKSSTVLAYLSSALMTLIQNGVRGIPLGQTEGQQLYLSFQHKLLKALETIQGLELEDFGLTSPGLELSQMKHERLHFRLFMS